MGRRAKIAFSSSVLIAIVLQPTKLGPEEIEMLRRSKPILVLILFAATSSTASAVGHSVIMNSNLSPYLHLTRHEFLINDAFPVYHKLVRPQLIYEDFDTCLIFIIAAAIAFINPQSGFEIWEEFFPR